MATCMESCENYTYMAGNLVAEVGELWGKVSKAMRKGQITTTMTGNIAYRFDTIEELVEFKKELFKEAGDVLWQLSGLCSVMMWKLEDVAQGNLDKLASRQRRGVIDGSGDNR